MKHFLAAWMALMTATTSLGCDVCGIFLGIQPHDRTSSASLFWRYRRLEGTLATGGVPLPVKHGNHATTDAVPAQDQHYRELYQVAEVRGDIWWSDRWATLVSVPLVNNYRAVDGIIDNDVYGIGDPFFITRYLVVNTKCTTTDERTVHRVMLGGGAKLPLGRTDVLYNGGEVVHDQHPGSGSWDLLLSAEYMVRRGSNGASLNMVARRNGTNDHDYRMGHGLSTTVEYFHRWDIGDWKVLPSVGAYHELAGLDAEVGEPVSGTGSSTFFTHTGVRLWWRSIGITTTYQRAIAQHIGADMIPNKERFVLGLTYNFNTNSN